MVQGLEEVKGLWLLTFVGACVLPRSFLCFLYEGEEDREGSGFAHVEQQNASKVGNNLRVATQ